MSTILDQHIKNWNSVEKIFNFFQLIPSQLMPQAASLKIVPLLIEGLNLDLRPEEIENGFYLIYMLSVSQETVPEIAACGVIELAFSKNLEMEFY
jgi:hypothetical protein